MDYDETEEIVSRFGHTTQLVYRQALERGWKVEVPYASRPYLWLTRQDGKTIEIISATPPTISYIAGERASNKYLTTISQQKAGLPVPKTFLTKNLETTENAVKEILGEGSTAVIKPLDASHGNGITLGVQDMAGVKSAFKFASQHASSFIVQEFLVSFHDIRITCIDYKCVGAVIRIPARVMADGEKTIGDLIVQENQNPDRGENYQKTMNIIDIEQSRRFLGDRLHEIPNAGEWVQVVGVANLGMGGELLDVTDDLPGWFVEMAEKSALVAELPVCGVDLVKKAPETNDTQEALIPKLIEINRCPALFLNERPTHGTPRPIITKYLDYLETI